MSIVPEANLAAEGESVLSAFPADRVRSGDMSFPHHGPLLKFSKTGPGEAASFNRIVDAALERSGLALSGASKDWSLLRYDCEALERSLNARLKVDIHAEHDWRRGIHCIGLATDRILSVPHRDVSRRVFAYLGNGAPKPAALFGTNENAPPCGAATLERLLAEAPETAAPNFHMPAPDILLVALYHPENFPLPRFALGISDIARAIRERRLGRVRMRDMQLGVTVQDIAEEIRISRPDIVGISATFGQHDVLEQLLYMVAALKVADPMIVLGGSLSALNRNELATRGFFVATGPGERTMVHLVEHFCGLRGIQEVSGLCYRAGDGATVTSAKIDNRKEADLLPELDLVEQTLKIGGVTQLETSRGCSYACSFCPREHKGIWSGKESTLIEPLLADLSEIYGRHPQRSRKLFLVDEEFFGYRREAEARVREIALLLSNYGFLFETSARVDQVCHRNRDDRWHVDRIALWRDLVALGLDRCLFGIESGVDSILERFNKKTSAAQNVQAIRTLTAAGVPIRFTYITFDPLMTLDELVATHVFLSRRDLVLGAQPKLSPSAIHGAVTDEGRVRELSIDTPFYREVSYQLVSMEALIGSRFLAELEAQQLAQATNLNMGRRETRYREARIGLISSCCQLWIDRNFSFDYLLKSLEKVLPRELRAHVREMRAVLKDYAHLLLSGFLNAAVPGAIEFPADFPRALMDSLSYGFDRMTQLDDDAARAGAIGMMDWLFVQLVAEVSQRKAELVAALQDHDAELMRKLSASHSDWKSRRKWALINSECRNGVVRA